MTNLSYKTLFIILLFLLIPIVLLLRINQKPTPTSAWWNDSWTYRKAVNIGWTGTELTDFQVSFDIGTSALINSGKMQSDCDDIRITDSRGNLLPHWTDGCNQATDTKVWIKIPSISSDIAIYIYYGNPSANSTSSVANTFIREIDNVIGAWNMNENIGTSTTDTSGNSHTGTFGTTNYTPAWATGKYSIGISFDGSNDYVSTGDLGIGDAYTAETWIKANTLTGGNADQTTFGYTVMASAATGGGYPFWLTVYGTEVRLWAYETSSTGYRETAGANLTTGTWFHITATAIKGGATKVYVNGVEKLSFTNDSEVNWTNIFTFGDLRPTRTIGFNGTIDHTHVYNNVLTQSEISDLYNNYGYTTTNYPGKVLVRKYSASDPTTTAQSEETGTAPIAYWSFDEGVGSTAFDAAGNNHGNISGATWQTEDMCIAGKCIYFDGIDDQINLPSLPGIPTPYTVSYWFKPQKLGAQTFISLKGSNSYPFFMMYHSNKLLAYCGAEKYRYGTKVFTESDLNRWYFVSYVVQSDSSLTNWKVYLDGKDDTGTAGGNTDTYFAPSSSGTIGISDSLRFQGFIDEVKIYPYARTPDQILEDYNDGAVVVGARRDAPGIDGGLSSGLVAYYNMDTGTGTTIADLSGNGNTGTFGTGDSAPGWSTGKFGIGTSYDGVNDYAHLSYSTEIDGDNPHTISAWVKSNTTSDTKTIIGHTNGGRADMWQTTNDLRCRGFDLTSYTADGTTNINDGSWHHLVCIFDNTGIKAYVDGKLEGSNTNITNAGSGNFRIGKSGSTSPTGPIDGLIDEVRIYNRALSSSEVADLYAWAPGPVLHLKLDENQGTTAYDSSGNSLNGTIDNASWTTGKYGAGLNFQNTTDQVTVSHNSKLVLSSAFTISTWVYPTVQSGNQIILTKNQDSFQGYSLLLWSNLSNLDFRGRFNDCVNGTIDHFLSTGGISINTWTYLTLTYDSNLSTNNLKFFKNGILISKTTETGNLCPANSANFVLHSTGEPYYGKKDDTKVYNYARSPEQILQDMWNGVTSASGRNTVLHPIVNWSFDEGYGTIAHDESPQKNNGTLTCGGTGCSVPEWTNEGKFGKALYFTGEAAVWRSLVTREEINLGTNTGDKLTFSAWIKPDSTQTGSGWIVRNGYSVDENYGVRIGSSKSDNKYKVSIEYYDGSFRSQSTSGYHVPAETWSHLLMVFSQGDWVDVYVNGILAERITWQYENSVTATSSFNIGGHNGTTNQFFQGLIDEVKIYNYALTADEVALDYNQGQTAVMGSLSSNTGTTASPNSASAEYCVPGDSTACAPPVAEWKLDENTGSSTYDSSGNGNTGTLGSGNSAPSWSPGKHGPALKFDGTNDYVQINDSPSLRIQNHTLSMWLKKNTANILSNQVLLVKKRGGSNLYSYDFEIYANNDVVRYVLHDGTSAKDWISSTQIMDTNWHHIALTYSGTTMSIYLDGIFKESTDSGLGTLNYTSDYLFIGSWTEKNYNFSGLIDQVRIYDYARTPAQIAWDYNQGAPVAHYKLNECQGSTVHSTNETYNSSLNGTINADTIGTCTSSGAWYNGHTGKIGASLYLDGDADYISVGDIGTSATALSFWIKPDSTTQSIIELSASDSVSISSGTISVTGFGSETVYVDGRPSTTVSDTNWHHLTIVSSANIPANTVNIGKIGSSYYSGQIDDVQIFNYALTAEQVKTLYNNGAVSFTD